MSATNSRGNHRPIRAIGIIRQSKGTEEALSPAEQRGRIEEHCSREGWELVAAHEEIDVSGGNPLSARDGLRAAVEATEAGRADVVIVAYFDRLFRSLAVQGEVVSRVEAAGGRVIALDFGEVTDKTAAQWLSGTLIGAVSEYYRRSLRERSGKAQALAIERGIVPYNNIPPGYRLGEDRRMEPDPVTAPVVREAFTLRRDGATIMEVRAFLRENGIERSFHGVQHLLGSAVYVGELHFGSKVNREAHEPIIDRGVWEAVQRMRGKRAPHPKSDRLLARLGVLRCGTCGARMVVGMQTQNGRRYPFYRCPPIADCPKRVTIGAEMVEGLVTDTVRTALRDVQGRASAEARGREAAAGLERAQADLDAALRAFAGLEGEAAARERLGELRAARDAAQEHVDHLGGLSLTFDPGEGWDALTLAERRQFVTAVIARVEVHPGRGLERVTVTLRE